MCNIILSFDGKIKIFIKNLSTELEAYDKALALYLKKKIAAILK